MLKNIVILFLLKAILLNLYVIYYNPKDAGENSYPFNWKQFVLC